MRRDPPLLCVETACLLRHSTDLSDERAAFFNIFGEDHGANILIGAREAK
jgi:hypothetical protein